MEYIKPTKLAKTFGEQNQEFLKILRRRIKETVKSKTRALAFGRFYNGMVFGACKEKGKLLFWIMNLGLDKILEAIEEESLYLIDFSWS